MPRIKKQKREKKPETTAEFFLELGPGFRERMALPFWNWTFDSGASDSRHWLSVPWNLTFFDYTQKPIEQGTRVNKHTLLFTAALLIR